MTSIKEALTWATKTLKNASESPSLDADVLLAHVTDELKSFLYGHPESVIKEEEWQTFRKLVSRRANGEPIAYLTGTKEFYGKLFNVTPDVLIPRPSTEHLVDAVLDEFDNTPVTVADIGTGSGAVAVALKLKAPRMHVLATDISKAAIEVAHTNAKQHEVDISFSYGNLTEPIKSKVDGLVANLPYLTNEESESPALEFEPMVALTGGEEGLDIFRTFFFQAPEAIKPNGRIFLEIGHEQAEAVSEMASIAFPNAEIEIRKDLGDFDRVVIIRLGDKPHKSPLRGKTTGLHHLLRNPMSPFRR